MQNIIETWDEAKGMAQDVEEDPNYYLEVQEKYMDSVQAKLNTLRASLQEFWNSLLDTGVINLVIEGLTMIVDVGQSILGVFNSIKDTVGGLGGSIASIATALASAAAAYKTFQNVKSVGTLFGGIGKTGSDVKGGIGGIISTITSLFSKDSRDSLWGGLKEISAKYNDMSKNGKIGILEAFDDAGGGLQGLTAGFSALAGKIGISTKALFGFGAAAAAITAAVAAFDYFTDSTEETAKAVEDLNTKYQETQITFQKNRKTIDEIGSEWERLSEGVDYFGENISLTSDEFDRYHELSNQIAEMYPTLVAGYDAQGNAVLNLKNGLSDLNDEYERQLAVESHRRVSEDLSTYQENFNNIIGDRSWGTEVADNFGNLFGAAKEGGRVTTGEIYKTLEQMQKMTRDELKLFMMSLPALNNDLYSYFASAAGGGLYDALEEEGFDEVKKLIAEKMEETRSTIETAAGDLRLVMQDYLNTLTLADGKYNDLDSSTIESIQKYISTLTPEQMELFDGEEENLKKYIDDLVKNISDDESAQLSLKNLLSINEDTDIEEIKKIVENDVENLSNALELDEEAKVQLKVQFGIEEKEELIKQYDQIVEDLSRDLDDQAKDTINRLQQEVDSVGGSLDFGNRKAASADTIRDAGYNLDDNTDYSYVSKVVEAKDRTFVLSPVLPNGEVMDEDTFNEYVDEVIKTGEDKDDLAIAVFDKKSVKNGKDTRKEAEKFVDSLEEAEKYSGYLGDNQELVKDFISDNNIRTKEQVDLLWECYEATGNWAEAMAKFSAENVDLELNEKILQSLEDNLTVVKGNIDNIKQAVESTNDSVGMSREEIDNVVKAFSGLDGYDYDALFESTAEGVKLNAQELAKLNKEYEKQESSKYQTTIESLEKQYSSTCAEIDKLTQGTDEYYEKLSQRDALKQQIKDAQELQSMYEGLTNSVTKYFDARESTDPDADYQSITGDIEEIEEMWKHGEVGRDDFQAFVQMFTNANLQSIDDFVNAYDGAIAKAKRYFTENASGVENFLKDVQSKDSSLASVDENGVWTIDASIETLSEKMGMTQAAIQEMFNRLKVYGFDVDFVEAEDYLREMRDEALEANKVFSGIDDWKIDLDVSDPDKIREQVDLMEAMKDTIKETYGANSSEFEAFNKQLDYMHAKLGEIASDEWTVDIHSDEGLDKLNADLNKLREMGRLDIEIDFGNKDPEYIATKIDEVTASAEDLKRNKDGTIIIDQQGGAETISVLSALIQAQQELKYNERVILDIDVSKISDSAQQAITKLQEVEIAYQNLDTMQAMQEKGIPVDTTALDEAREKLVTVTQEFANANPTVAAQLKLDSDNIDFKEEDKAKVASKVSEVMAGIDAKTMLTIEGVNDEAIKGYNPGTKTLKIDVNDDKVDGLKQKIDTWVATEKKLTFTQSGLNKMYNTYSGIKNKTITITVNQKQGTKVSGDGELHGNVNFGGHSFANGTIGAPEDEISLTGEEGPELRVDRKTGRWELLGENGAEFAKVNKGDLIFNTDQTRELFRYGKVKSNGGRGRAFINGTVGKLNSLFKVGSGNSYVSGNYTTGGSLSGSNKFYNDHNWSSDKDKDKNTEKPKESDFDWIEVAIQRIEEAIERLDIAANSAYKSLTNRNSSLSQEFSKVTEQINLQRQAYDAYMREANAVGLSDVYKNKIHNGTMDVETIVGNDALVEQINKYQEFYEKAIEASDAVLELQETLGDLAKAKFDNVVTQYDAELSEIEFRIEMIETGLDMVEAKGNLAGKKYFDELIKIEQENISKLEQEYHALQNSFNEAMSTGTIEANSEAYYDMQEQIREVQQAWQDAKLSLIEYQNQMREMDWEIFDKMIEYQSQITDESDFIRELMSFNDNDLFDKETGQLSDKGMAVGGLHAVDYNVYMAQADEYRKKIEELNAEIEKDPTNTNLIDQRNEYLEQQREAILNAEDEKQAIKDLIQDSYERMLDVLQELIDKRKEALEAEKDLYDYQKNIEEQTKNITDLQKQLAALQGDDSEEAKSKRQQLQSQLEEAQGELEETEYEKWLDDQQKILDDFYNEYEEFLNMRLDDINALMTEMIDNTNANSELIDQTIKDSTADVGYKVTDGMNNIWNNTGSGIGKVVSDYSANFTNMLTTTNEYMKSIRELVGKLVDQSLQQIGSNTGGVIGGGGSSGSGGGAGGGGGSGGGGSAGGGGGGSFFIYKADSYPKNRLDKERSIVDRLKWHNFDSSMAARRSYYQAMGLGSASSYTGGYSQNMAMLNWMKTHGYKNGGTVGSLVKKSGEDGFILARTGEEVLSLDKLKIADNMVSQLIDFARFVPNVSGRSTQTTSAEVNLNLSLPNVRDSQSLIKEIQNSRQVQQALVDVTIGKALGKNTLNVYKRK